MLLKIIKIKILETTKIALEIKIMENIVNHNIIIEIQDNILREAWKKGALSSEYYDWWIENVYANQIGDELKYLQN